MFFSVQNRESGVTLIELLIAMALSGIILGTIAGIFIIQRKTYDTQEQITEIIMTARAATDMITREVRMAGYYNPIGGTEMQRSDPIKTNFVGIPYAPKQLQIISDLNDDGSTTGPNENITYAYYDKTNQIKRKTGKGYFQPFSENIEEFKFDYLDSAGNATTSTADIRQIKITITARTSKPDPDYSANGGFRKYTLISTITPRNLML